VQPIACSSTYRYKYTCIHIHNRAYHQLGTRNLDSAVMDLDMVRANDRMGRIYQHINMVRSNMVLTGMHVSQSSEFALIDTFSHLT
jgi:hypothetical protein